MNNWNYEDQMAFESDVKDSINAEVAYFHCNPSYNDIQEEKDFNECCYSFFTEI